MRILDQNWSLWHVLSAFFPFRLIIAHLKHNLISLIFWTFMFMIVFDKLGSSFGVPFLFLSPEYLGEVSNLSFVLLGFAIGGFTMGFNTYSYIKVGAHFPFLTTLSKPFLRFSINNGLIPIAFLITHIILIIDFQLNEELKSSMDIFLYALSYLGGFTLFIVLSILYFFPMSRRKKSYEMHSNKPIQSVILRKGKWYEVFTRQKDHTYIYIGKNLKLLPSRSSKHFDEELVEKIFAKNRINASLFEILNILIFFVLGIFSDYQLFEVPAATSIVLLLTISLMLFSALHAWLRRWVYPVMIATILTMNWLSIKTRMFNYTSYAYGISYDNPSEYSISKLIKISNNNNLQDQTKDQYIQTLSNWKAQSGDEKPKLVIINTSGGGSRSALWTMMVLSEADRVSNGKLMLNTQMITGASGGMIGAAYFRSLFLEYRLGRIKDYRDDIYLEDMSKDILNKLSFMASTNDIFIRYQKYESNGNLYTKDRGYAFERQLQKNTRELFDHPLKHFQSYESKAIVPTMIFTPTIINDGRRLFIGSQPLNFLTNQKIHDSNVTPTFENIDIYSLLDKQDPGNMDYTSVLRSSATFPFVMPMITLPTSPEIQLMDAGIRDNYGAKATSQYLYALNDWITKNTSGVIILQIRDTKKIMEDEEYSQVSFLDKITLPFGNMYSNFPEVQTHNQEELLGLSKANFDFPIDIITFNLMQKKEDRISLSWHLTKQERQRVKSAFYSRSNQESLIHLLQLLNSSK